MWVILLAACARLQAGFEGDDADECRNGADDDRDGHFDCEDQDCWGSPDCPDSGGSALDTDTDTDSDSDTDADTDADSDSDSDSDTDTGDLGGFVEIPAQTFEMGCTPGQATYCDPDDPWMRPHTVKLTQAFLLGVTEVTVGEYERVTGVRAGLDGCTADDCPVEDVSWSDAARFANLRSAEEGLAQCYTPDGADVSGDPYACEGYRLPTESEWEAAARCGEDSMYAGSDDWTQVAVADARSSAPVGSLAANACGLYDMSGNEWEWVTDWFDEYPDAATTNPTGAASGTLRVSRGGGWGRPPEYARLALRGRDEPSEHDITTGLRLAKTAP